MLPYRLCAIDLDDTLLGPDHAISLRNAEAVRAAIEKGVTVVLATGRMHESAIRYAEQLQLETPILSYNGALVKTPHTDDIWFQARVPADLAATILDFCRERDLQLNWYLDDRIYTAAFTPWLKLYHERTRSPYEVRPDFYEFVRGTEPIKLLIVNSLEYTNSLLEPFRAQFGDKLYVTKTTDEYLEFMPPEANKGAALATITQHYGIPQAETIAFGDSFNDIPMIQWAGLGVAVGNAKPEVIAAADRVVLKSAEDGVGLALEEIFGLPPLS